MKRNLGDREVIRVGIFQKREACLQAAAGDKVGKAVRHALKQCVQPANRHSKIVCGTLRRAMRVPQMCFDIGQNPLALKTAVVVENWSRKIGQGVKVCSAVYRRNRV